MYQFHKYWLSGNEMAGEKPLPPTTALRKAQLWLRGLTRMQVICELQALASVQLSEMIAKEIQVLDESIAEQPYAHPYFWSTFYVTGGVLWTH
jgi:CHAT domain-containing protein